ncbi:UNVERIFIED_CONTAM: hypothetical protein NCL1_30217 [Trichonephila clavipes]
MNSLVKANDYVDASKAIWIYKNRHLTVMFHSNSLVEKQNNFIYPVCTTVEIWHSKQIQVFIFCIALKK